MEKKEQRRGRSKDQPRSGREGGTQLFLPRSDAKPWELLPQAVQLFDRSHYSLFPPVLELAFFLFVKKQKKTQKNKNKQQQKKPFIIR